MRLHRIISETDDPDDIEGSISGSLHKILSPIKDRFPGIIIDIDRAVSEMIRYNVAKLSIDDSGQYAPLIIAINSGYHSRYSHGPRPDERGAVAVKIQNTTSKSSGRFVKVSSEDELLRYIETWYKKKPKMRVRQEAQPERFDNWQIPDDFNANIAPIGNGIPQPRQRNPKQIPVTTEIFNIDKSSFFPRIAFYSNRSIPGPLSSTGKPFTITIYGKNIDIPEEIFASMDLHHRADKKPMFLGWIGGNIHNNVMYIDEVQSDLMQRTIELTDQKKFNQNQKQSIEQLDQEIQNLRREIANIKKHQTTGSATQIFGLMSQLQEKIREQKAIQKDKKHFKLSKYSEYKSRVENTFKKWIMAFYHTAINHARKLGLSELSVVPTRRNDRRGEASSEESIYYRAYDKVAKSFGAELINGRWHISLDKIPYMEDIAISHIASILTEDVLEEALDREIIEKWFQHANITLFQTSGNYPDADYNQLSMIITKQDPDGNQIITQEHNDLSPDTIHKALGRIDQDNFEIPLESSPYELEEFNRDASLLVSGYKIVDGIPYGISIYSLDKPGETYVYDAESEDNFGDMSDEELFGIDPNEYKDAWGDE